MLDIRLSQTVVPNLHTTRDCKCTQLTASLVSPIKAWLPLLLPLL